MRQTTLNSNSKFESSLKSFTLSTNSLSLFCLLSYFLSFFQLRFQQMQFWITNQPIPTVIGTRLILWRSMWTATEVRILNHYLCSCSNYWNLLLLSLSFSIWCCCSLEITTYDFELCIHFNIIGSSRYSIYSARSEWIVYNSGEFVLTITLLILSNFD